jgi:hypothetical protein
VAVTIATTAVPGLTVARLNSTTLTVRQDAASSDGGSTFRLRRVSPGSAEVRVENDAPGYCSLPRIVLAPEIDPARRVAAALESSRNDPPFQNALPHLLWLLEA